MRTTLRFFKKGARKASRSIEKRFVLSFALSLVLLMFLGVFTITSFLDTTVTSAQQPQPAELGGFAWSSNTGWIIFNSANCDTNANGFIDTGACGGSDTSLTPVIDYAVSVDLPASGTKKLSGYAWANPIDIQDCDANNNGFIDRDIPGKTCGGNDDITTPVATYANASKNIGWITFNEAELVGCRTSPCNARMNFTARMLEGWARACSVFASGCSGALKPAATNGGWDGWISLSGVALDSSAYGVTYDSLSCQLQGYAWGGGDNSQVLGWISFSGVAQDSSPYSVYLASVSLPPDPPTELSLSANTDPPGTYCPAPWRLVFSFRYQDPEGAAMSAYQIQISRHPGFGEGNIIYDSAQTPLAGASGSTITVIKTFCSPFTCPGSSIFEYSTNYWWRVKVWDSGNPQCDAPPQESDWSNADKFKTPIHDWPKVVFSWTPAKPSAINEDTNFTNSTTFDIANGSTGQSFLWTFTGAISPLPTPTSDTAEQPAPRRYGAVGDFPTTLQATDDVGICQLQKIIPVAPPLPDYIER